jgi:formylmethanofuran dehydrogenase subunit E
MLRIFAFLCFSGFAAVCFAEDNLEGLPQPNYQPEKSDPSWLKDAAQFHGHLGPMVIFGARMGMAARKAVDAQGYFDVEITCEGPFVKPPDSCFLDGLQISTGATLGKRNLKWIEAKTIVIRVKNTRTGKTATLQPREEFLALLHRPTTEKKGESNANKLQPSDDHHSLESLARKIAAMPEKEILTVSQPGTSADDQEKKKE